MTMDHIVDVYPRRRGEALNYGLHETLSLAYEARMAGSAYAAVNEDGLTIACGGIFMSHHGVGNAWVFGTDDIKAHAKDLTRAIKDMLPQIMNDLNLNRVQADVLVEKPSWVRWAEYIGFEKEGVLRQFREGKDAYVMAVLRDNIIPSGNKVTHYTNDSEFCARTVNKE